MHELKEKHKQMNDICRVGQEDGKYVLKRDSISR